MEPKIGGRAKARALLSPPDMGGDEVLQFQADFLNVVVLTSIASIVLFLIFIAIEGRARPITLLLDVLTLLSTLLNWHWLKRGRTKLVGVGLSALGIPLIAMLLVSIGTIRTATSSFLILFILIATVLFDIKGFVVTWSSNAVILLGLIMAQRKGMLPPPDHAPSMSQWVMLVVLFALCGWFAAFALGRVRSALLRSMAELRERQRFEQELRRANEELAAANAELARHRDNLEDLVRQRTVELAAERDRAEGADRAKSAFLAAMSHEMRTPLHQILGMSYLLSSSVAGEEAKRQVTVIDKASRRLDAIVSDLLDYTRMESASIRIEEIDFELASVLDRALALVRDEAAAKGLVLERLIDRELPGGFRGDPARIAQLLGILLKNAVKFAERGAVRLKVERLHQAGTIPALRFSVEDEGIGMSPERVASMFAPFRQGDEESTRRYEGVGLGLALARRLVKLMAGEMDVRSEPGRGSVFSFTLRLPLRAEVPAGAVAVPDREQALTARDYLMKLLDENDTKALDLWKESRNLLEAALACPSAEIDGALAAFDFAQAARLLGSARTDSTS